jgi:hypothetical protein
MEVVQMKELKKIYQKVDYLILLRELEILKTLPIEKVGQAIEILIEELDFRNGF